MKNKSATSFEAITLFWRTSLTILVALTILGISSFFYQTYIDVRDVEARIMTHEIVNCIYVDGYVDYDLLIEEESVFSYCGYSKDELERFFINLELFDGPENVINFTYGDSGKLWIKELFDNQKKRISSDAVLKYEPGYFKDSYEINILRNEIFSKGKIVVEVLVNDEF